MSSSFPIPVLIIKYKLFHDPEITTIEQLAKIIAADSELTFQIAPQKAVLALWEMTRCNVLLNRDPSLTSLYKTWNELGYTNTQEHYLISSTNNLGPMNIKLSMLLGQECFGTWALIPVEIWNIAKENEQRSP